ncbi:hypothetical protein [Streptomyces noursei]
MDDSSQRVPRQIPALDEAQLRLLADSVNALAPHQLRKTVALRLLLDNVAPLDICRAPRRGFIPATASTPPLLDHPSKAGWETSPLSPVTADAITRYLDTHACDMLLPGISQEALQKMLSERLEAADLPQVNLHILRNSLKLRETLEGVQ